jgi:hypothetical protein
MLRLVVSYIFSIHGKCKGDHLRRASQIGLRRTLVYVTEKWMLSSYLSYVNLLG